MVLCATEHIRAGKQYSEGLFSDSGKKNLRLNYYFKIIYTSITCIWLFHS